MLIALTGFMTLLALLALVQSVGASRRARQNRLAALRKKIEANDRQKLLAKLEQKNRPRNRRQSGE